MDNYRWIKCTYVGLNDSHDVVVRQSERFSDVFLDERGNRFGVADLDFTKIPEEEKAVFEGIVQSQESLNRMNEEHERTQNQLRDMLAAMDTRAIADHKAEIDEREYWRNLRRDIFMKILERGGEFKRQEQLEWAIEQTKRIFNRLYAQHQEFTNKG